MSQVKIIECFTIVPHGSEDGNPLLERIGKGESELVVVLDIDAIIPKPLKSSWGHCKGSPVDRAGSRRGGGVVNGEDCCPAWRVSTGYDSTTKVATTELR